MRPAKPFAVTATAIALCLGAAASAQDMDEYIEMFDPLPALPPIPADGTMSAERIDLGRMLFFEPRISASGVISCATCHNPALGWTDRISRATGHDGQVGERNTPTVLNSGFLGSQFWDGREPDLEGQALGPIQAEIEMNMTLEQAIDRLNEFDVYREAFSAAFPDDSDPVNPPNVALAIAAFERTLNTPNSPFDRFLMGDEAAMTEQQQNGMRLFVDNGCVACHNGPNLSDSNFHHFELPGSTDAGRYLVTGDELDRSAFRTPTLRNVAVTYPYFNNGSVRELRDAVNLMGQQMLGHEFAEDELDDIVAFLESLTGEMPEVEVPALP
ncbi:MAG: cytochrome c peroxidase YhjA [Rhodobacteraceae bacterium HLUCCA12]|nr:MAG: cytochrome c peroxidase YhjA [Rhodobacteraceae bacterium HLUCCA12]